MHEVLPLPAAAPDRLMRACGGVTSLMRETAYLTLPGWRRNITEMSQARPARLTELSPDSVRGFLPGFAYQCGVLLVGGVAYLEAVFARRMSYAHAMALTAVTDFRMAAVVVALGREKRGIHFGIPKAA